MPDDGLNVALTEAHRGSHGCRLTDEMQGLRMIIREGSVTGSETVEPTLSTEFFQAPYDIIGRGHSAQYYLHTQQLPRRRRLSATLLQ